MLQSASAWLLALSLITPMGSGQGENYPNQTFSKCVTMAQEIGQWQKQQENYIYKFDGTITAYYNSPSETGKSPKDPDWGVTASGVKARTHHTIATSRSLPFHSVVRIEGLNGEYYVEDRGGAIKGQKVDLFVSNKKEAEQWGVQHRTIYVIKVGDGKINEQK